MRESYVKFFKELQDNNNDTTPKIVYKPVCLVLDEKTKEWKRDEGVTMENNFVATGFVQCKTTHFSSFTVGIDVTNNTNPVDPVDPVDPNPVDPKPKPPVI